MRVFGRPHNCGSGTIGLQMLAETGFRFLGRYQDLQYELRCMYTIFALKYRIHNKPNICIKNKKNMPLKPDLV